MIRSQVKKAADARARWEDDTYQDLMSRIDKVRTMFNVELSSSSQHQQRIIGSNGAGKSYTRQDVLQGHYQRKSCVFTSHRDNLDKRIIGCFCEFLGREGPLYASLHQILPLLPTRKGSKTPSRRASGEDRNASTRWGVFRNGWRFWLVSLPSKEQTYPIYLGTRRIIFRSVLGGDNLSS